MIQTSLKEWGNSKAVRIPKNIVSELGLESLKEPVNFDISIDHGKIVLTPIKKLTRLEMLFEGYDNKLTPPYSNFEWDEPVGDELF